MAHGLRTTPIHPRVFPLQPPEKLMEKKNWRHTPLGHLYGTALVVFTTSAIGIAIYEFHKLLH